MISVKIGQDIIFRENFISNNLPQNQYAMNQNQTFMNINSYNNNRNEYLRNNDVNLKIFENENNDKNLLEKVIQKKHLLNKIMNIYYTENQFNDLSNNISQIENEIKMINTKIDYDNKLDYSNFKILISSINLLDVENTSQYLNQISLEEYMNLLPEQKNNILIYINKYKNDFLLNLNCINTLNRSLSSAEIISYNQNVKRELKIEVDKNIYNNTQNTTINKYNQIYNLSNNSQEIKNIKTNPNQKYYNKEKFDLFRLMVGVPNLSNEKISEYINLNCTNVQQAVNKFFQNVYKAPYLTFTYYYPMYSGDPNRRTRIHKFKFTDSSKELFNQAIMDFSNIMKPRLFAESKQEIFLKPNIKCMGAYLLKNNQTITVKEIY